MAHDVFISYSSKDKTAADAVCATLEAHGIRCWIAPRDILPGTDWTDSIVDALSASRAFLLLLSQASNQSEQVKREVQVAVGDGIPILPVRMEEFPLSKHMQYFIGTPHWLDAMTPPLEKHLHKVADSISALLQIPRGPHHPADALTNSQPVAAPVPDAPTPAVTSTTPSTSPAPQWQPEILAIVEVQMCALIGPLGSLLVRRASAKANNLDELYEKLGPSLKDEKERQLLRQQCQLQLQKLQAQQEAAALAAQQAAPQTAPQAAGDAVAWPEQILKKAERDLAEYIGPVARVLVKKSAARTANLRELYQALADNIPDARERSLFLQSGLK